MSPCSHVVASGACATSVGALISTPRPATDESVASRRGSPPMPPAICQLDVGDPNSASVSRLTVTAGSWDCAQSVRLKSTARAIAHARHRSKKKERAMKAAENFPSGGELQTGSCHVFGMGRARACSNTRRGLRSPNPLVMKSRRSFLKTAALLSAVPVIARAAEEKAKREPAPASATDDRAVFIVALRRLAEPILNAGAARELKQRLPVRAAKGVKDRAEYTHLEAVGRLLCGISPWLEL